MPKSYVPSGAARGELQPGQQVDGGQTAPAERPRITEDDTAPGHRQPGTHVAAESGQAVGADDGRQDQRWGCHGVHSR